MDHNLLRGAIAAILLAAAALLHVTQAQEEGGRGGRGWRGRFDFAERLRQADANGNGLLEPDEIPDRMRFFVMGAAQQAGIDTSQPIPIDKLREAFEAQAARFGQMGRGPRGGPPDGAPAPGQQADQSPQPGNQQQDSTNSAKQKPEPLVPGFGETQKPPPVPSFGVDAQPAAQAANNAAPANGQTQQGNSGEDDRQRGRRRGWWFGPPAGPGSGQDGDTPANAGAGPGSGGPAFGGPGFGGPGFGGPGFGGRGNPNAGSRGGGSPGGDSGGTPGPQGSPGASSGSPPSGQDRIASMADAIIARSDQNNNGVLDGEEVRAGGMAVRNSDHNSDGIVTKEELIQTLSSWGQGRGGQGGSGQSAGQPSSQGGGQEGEGRRGGRGFGRREEGGNRASSGGSGSAGGGRSAAGGPATRRSYRALSPIERLPREIPDWFVRADENGDGQVAMAEYSSSWSDDKAAEFAAIDLDGDGIITAKECLRAGRSPRSLASAE